MNIRPQTLSEFVGQESLKAELKVYLDSARLRGKPLDHVLFFAPPGLGKTTLAHVISNEMGKGIKETTGIQLDSYEAIVSVVSDMEAGDVLFIDEIHRIPKKFQEVLYSLMEDFKLSPPVSKSRNYDPLSAAVSNMDKPLTVIGATTRAGLLTRPFLDRFGIKKTIPFYTEAELSKIVERTGHVIGVTITSDAVKNISQRSLGTPRIANTYVKRMFDFALSVGSKEINSEICEKGFKALEVDKRGLKPEDRKFMLTLLNQFKGGPVGLQTLSYALEEDKGTVSEMIEPILQKMGFLTLGPRGRSLTDLGKSYLA